MLSTMVAETTSNQDTHMAIRDRGARIVISAQCFDFAPL